MTGCLTPDPSRRRIPVQLLEAFDDVVRLFPGVRNGLAFVADALLIVALQLVVAHLLGSEIGPGKVGGFRFLLLFASLGGHGVSLRVGFRRCRGNGLISGMFHATPNIGGI
jgi:hypothetical protein